MAKTQIQKFAIIAFTSIVLLAGIYNKADAAVTCYTNCYGNMCTTTCY